MKKRHLPIETDDWKKVECLSWEDMKQVSELCGGVYISNMMSDNKKLENYIKNKLKSKATRQP